MIAGILQISRRQFALHRKVFHVKHRPVDGGGCRAKAARTWQGWAVVILRGCCGAGLSQRAYRASHVGFVRRLAARSSPFARRHVGLRRASLLHRHASVPGRLAGPDWDRRWLGSAGGLISVGRGRRTGRSAALRVGGGASTCRVWAHRAGKAIDLAVPAGPEKLRPRWQWQGDESSCLRKYSRGAM